MSTHREVADALSGYPYRELAFDRTGRPVDPGQAAAVHRLADLPEPITDLIVLAHGWNNDEAEAADLYRGLAASLAEVQGSDAWAAAAPSGLRLGLVGVFCQLVQQAQCLWVTTRYACFIVRVYMLQRHAQHQKLI